MIKQCRSSQSLKRNQFPVLLNDFFPGARRELDLKVADVVAQGCRDDKTERSRQIRQHGREQVDDTSTKARRRGFSIVKEGPDELQAWN
jgi:hypothetical protein